MSSLEKSNSDYRDSPQESLPVVDLNEPKTIVKSEQAQNQPDHEASNQQEARAEPAHSPVFAVADKAEKVVPGQWVETTQDAATVSFAGSTLLAGAAMLLSKVGNAELIRLLELELSAGLSLSAEALRSFQAFRQRHILWFSKVGEAVSVERITKIMSEIIQIAGTARIIDATQTRFTVVGGRLRVKIMLAAAGLGTSKIRQRNAEITEEADAAVLLDIAERAGAELIAITAQCAGAEVLEQLTKLMGSGLLAYVNRLAPHTLKILEIVRYAAKKLITDVVTPHFSDTALSEAIITLATEAVAPGRKRSRIVASPSAPAVQLIQSSGSLDSAHLVWAIDSARPMAEPIKQNTISGSCLQTIQTPVMPQTIYSVVTSESSPLKSEDSKRQPMLMTPKADRLSFCPGPTISYTAQSNSHPGQPIPYSGEPNFHSRQPPFHPDEQIFRQPTSHPSFSHPHSAQSSSSSHQPDSKTECFATSRPIAASSTRTCTNSGQSDPARSPTASSGKQARFDYPMAFSISRNDEPLSDTQAFTKPALDQPENRCDADFTQLIELALLPDGDLNPQKMILLARSLSRILAALVERNQDGYTFSINRLLFLQEATKMFDKNITISSRQVQIRQQPNASNHACN